MNTNDIVVTMHTFEVIFHRTNLKCILKHPHSVSALNQVYNEIEGATVAEW